MKLLLGSVGDLSVQIMKTTTQKTMKKIFSAPLEKSKGAIKNEIIKVIIMPKNFINPMPFQIFTSDFVLFGIIPMQFITPI